VRRREADLYRAPQALGAAAPDSTLRAWFAGARPGQVFGPRERAGQWWVYRYLDHQDGRRATFAEARPFVVQRGGVDPVSGPAQAGPGWVRVAPWTGEDAIPAPLEVGRAGPAPEGGDSGWTVESEETVAVPAGTFATFRCAYRTATAVSILWIAPAVGVVREAHGPPGGRPELERDLLRWAGPPRP
jgi:hypothetical protein